MKSTIYHQGPSMEDLADEEEKGSEQPDNRHSSIPNPLRSTDPGYKYGQSPKPNSTGNPRSCQYSAVPPFDTDRYAEFLLRLEYLKNIEVVKVPRPGEFLIRAMCMGQVYGHFPSGAAVLQSSSENSTRTDASVSDCPRSVDIYLDHDISFCIKFVDLIDNPLVLHLCHASEDMDPDSCDNLPPLGFICLDLGSIMRYTPGRLSEYSESWYIPEKSQLRVRNTNLRKGMLPGLQLTIDSIIGGFPDKRQLMQGNLMTVHCESFHNLPPIVNQNVSYVENYPDVTMFMTLPHSQTEPVLKFPGAKYKETFLLEPNFKKLSIDENTQTNPSYADVPTQQQRVGRHSMMEATHALSVQMNQPPREPRHWASVKENFPDTPMEATVMQPDLVFDPIEASADTDVEIFGDGREDFMEFSETGDPRLVWNSMHRKYIPVDDYRGMLARLSQNAIWPIEICVAVKKRTAEKHKKKKETVAAAANNKSMLTQQQSDAPDSQQIPRSSNSNESNDKMLMGELGQQSATATSEYTLIYHGVAFVDLSCLVHPGMKSARFSCKLFPFSTDLLQKRTCAKESVVPELLLLTLLSKASGESSKMANTTSKRQTQVPTQSNMSGGGNNVTTSSKTVRPSQGSENRVSQQGLQHHGSISKRSDTDPNESKKKLHVHGSVDETAENTGQQVIERSPFIVFRISLLRSVVPCYKTAEIFNVVDDYLPKRKLSRRKLVSSSSAQQKYKRAILEAATEISHEFSDHYWKEVLQNGQTGKDQSSTNNATNETLKKGFLFYLNASGRYLILREHLRSAISSIVQQKCMVLRPHGFHNHRDFQSYLHDMYIFLVDEMNEILSGTTVQETDPLKSNLDRLLQQTNCSPDDDLSKVSLHNRQITDLGVYAEESLAQGDHETCHKLHLQRICRDQESSRCWTEFAIMWLARGDDRMAEIAVREALRKDPLHLYALLISGMISVRHGDAGGLECLGAALGLFPMAPEILVIVGVANSVNGNGVAADYFFRKAAYIHRTITGQPTGDIDKLFTDNNAKKPFNMKQFTHDLDTGVSHFPEQKRVHVQAEDIHSDSQPQDAPRKSKKLSKSRFSKTEGLNVSLNDKRKRSSAFRRSGNVSVAVPAAVENDIDGQKVPNAPSKEKRRSNDMNNNNMSKSIDVSASGLPLVDPSTETLASEFTAQQPPNTGPIYSFKENLSDILQEEMILPLMTPSLQSPSDVTQFNEKLEKHLLTIDYLEKIGGSRMSTRRTQEQLETDSRIKSKGPNAFNVYIPKDEGVAPDNQIKEEYDKIINSTIDMDEKESESTKVASGTGSKSGTIRGSIDGMSQNSKSKRSSKRISIEEDLKNENTTTSIKQSEVASAGPLVPESTMDMQTNVKIPTESVPQMPKLTDRLGSELIWAAQLLINLRLFDYADGALAKHLYFYGKRTVQFIYLRALSLYLRQREEEALPLIKEAIEYDNSNGTYYALEGHCYYVLGNNQQAIASYEKALKVPHMNENRHLLYLRYGSLVLDLGKSKVAKRVFLHGVSKYPTPYMWLALGSACFQRQEYDQAESSFAEANRLDSTNPIAWGHLALSSLTQNKRALAEQSYKWALRFGLKKGVLMNEIQRLQKEKGFGDPSFPRIPNCVPHDYYLRRMGRMKPFNLYKEALNQDPPRMWKDRYQDTENEIMLKKKLLLLANRENEREWEGEGGEYEEGNNEGTEGIPNHQTQSTGFKIQTTSPNKGGQTVHSAPPDLVTVIKSPQPMK